MTHLHRRSLAELSGIADQIMIEHGFEPEFSPEVKEELAELAQNPPKIAANGEVKDLRGLLWSSIDNDTSRDLDQIEYAERMPDGTIKVMIGIADVDSCAAKDTAIDLHAAKETTSVYTGVKMYPMLPEALSTGVTSLLEGEERMGIVIEFAVGSDGQIGKSDVYRAIMRNKAQLTYDAVGAWLDGNGTPPAKVAASGELQLQLKLQNEAAQALKQERARHGALDIESVEVRPVMDDGQVVDLVKEERTRASELIEDFMIAANEVVARTLEAGKMSSIRRVVKTPKRWDRIVALASQHGTTLPTQPDSKALNDFLTKSKAADPDRYADLSLAVIKLMGPGEYVLERAGDPPQGHFGLAVEDYTHSTAPNRRYADLVTQRLLKAMFAQKASPYSDDALAEIATNCTLKQDQARKVERELSKRIAAAAMAHRVGQEFDAIVTGVTPHGTYVRILKPHVEGMLAQGHEGVDVGDKLRVKLISTDPQRGYIDFARE